MTSDGRVLEVEYLDAKSFGQDYRANLSNGGVFVATGERFEPREIVWVRLRLDWCDRRIDLEGEVVHIVPPELIEVGGRPGVAVQFLESPAGVRDRLAPLCDDPGTSLSPAPGDSRRAPRKRVRVAARLDSDGGSLWGRTRNLSRSGVLIGLQGGSLPLGERVRVAMRHPTTDDELEIAGVVVRSVQSGGRVSALAVHFDLDGVDRERVERFVEEVQGAEHTRQLGGITGPIAELGPESIVQMFATSAPKGTLILRKGQEEGAICFEGGALRLARLGAVSGMKALVRMLSWREGSFEFHTAVEEEGGGEDLPIEAAVFDAVRQIDEGGRLDPASFPLQGRLVAMPGAADASAGELTKVEAALLDLARVGFTVQRALEVIPEPDPEIFRALQALVDLGALELR